jgi:glyoxylase-like metal-dependent hydrolase (beta-lactamase superfamily II)
MKNSNLSEHFTLHQLADGIYAAVATESGAGFSNAGLIDLGDQVLVFDSFENPQAAEDLLKACRQITGQEPAVVIISHWHPDHWGGLQVFAGRGILATPETRQAMLPIAQEMLADKSNPASLEAELQDTETRLAREKKANPRKALEISIARQRHTLQALPTLQPTLPSQTFEGKVVFHGARRTAELVATGKGHTLSDCLLRLPQERLAFIGDIGFFQSQPFMPFGFPAEWVALLKEMAGWEIDTFIPGHGPVGSKTDLALEADYILALEVLVAKVVQTGGNVDDALHQVLPEPFTAWQAVGHRFEANVRAAFKRQSGN